jgi:FeS assembly SUF system protein
MQPYEYVNSMDIHDHLLDELQNQKITETQLKAIADAPDFREKAIAVLRTVHDPEIPVNIWELGLVYDLGIDEQHNVNIQMTLTAPTCPVAEAIPVEVKKRLIELLPGVNDVTVTLVWEPAWEKSMMSEEAKLVLDMW